MSKKKIDNPIWQKKEEWWYNVWKKVEPPFCPSKGQIKFYEKIIKNKILKRKNPRILVLGVTPQIRDLLAKYKKLDVYLIDIDVPVYRAMTRLVKKKNPREKLIVGDWLKMPFEKNYFDLIMAHSSFSVISLKHHKLFYQNIKRVLKKDGYVLMSRGILEFAFKDPINFKQFFNKYKKDPKYFKNFQNRTYILYRLINRPGIYDRRTQGFKWHVMAKGLMDYGKRQGFSEKQIKSLYFLPEIGPEAVYTDTDIESAKKVKSMIRKHFIIKQIHQDNYHPIAKIFIDFLCQKRK